MKTLLICCCLFSSLNSVYGVIPVNDYALNVLKLIDDVLENADRYSDYKEQAKQTHEQIKQANSLGDLQTVIGKAQQTQNKLDKLGEAMWDYWDKVQDQEQKKREGNGDYSLNGQVKKTYESKAGVLNTNTNEITSATDPYAIVNDAIQASEGVTGAQGDQITQARKDISGKIESLMTTANFDAATDQELQKLLVLSIGYQSKLLDAMATEQKAAAISQQKVNDIIIEESRKDRANQQKSKNIPVSTAAATGKKFRDDLNSDLDSFMKNINSKKTGN
ncbi:MAG: hypothetical protein HRT88_00260 [Lentisphaeraceae bacterium]|nr:hypothetical protein [Lentisphaeraceae bacterium]